MSNGEVEDIEIPAEEGKKKIWNKPIELWQENRKERKAQEEAKRHELIAQYSVIIDEMPVEAKQLLTSSMGSIIITPQDSFMAYFKSAIPKYDAEVFKIKFVETFSAIGDRAMHNLMKKKKKGVGNASDAFWQEFEILFDGLPGSKGHRDPFLKRIKIILMSIWQALKWSKRVLFAGIL